MILRIVRCWALVAVVAAAASNLSAGESPVLMTCKVFGKLVKCNVSNAEGLIERVWLYEKYSADHSPTEGSGFIEITSHDCSPIMFLGSEPDTSVTHVAEANVRLTRAGVATFNGCTQERVKEHRKRD